MYGLMMIRKLCFKASNLLFTLTDYQKVYTVKNPLELHKVLLQSKIEYCAIGNFLNAGFNLNSAMAILTSNHEAIIQLLQLERDKEYNNSITYKKVFNESPGNKCSFMIYRSGKGLYPSKFETELMKRSVINETDSCRIPDYECHFWLVLYRSVVHMGMYGAEERKILLQKIEQRVGLSRPDPSYFKHVSYHPRWQDVSPTWKKIDEEFKSSTIHCGW